MQKIHPELTESNMHPNFEPYWTNYLKQFDITNNHFKLPEKTNKHCVIIECRTHPNLIYVIKNFMHLLQNHGWGLVIFHGTQNEQFLKTELKDVDNILYFNINHDNIDAHKYNILLTQQAFWKSLHDIGCEHALVFQMDTLLFKDNVDDYLEYDYIGAPWCIKFHGLTLGNGGFSLRNTKIMLEITANYPYSLFASGRENEDIYFSFIALQLKCNIPSFDIAKKFSVETIYYEEPTGMHKPHIDKFPSKEHYVKLLSKRFDMADT